MNEYYLFRFMLLTSVNLLVVRYTRK